MSLFTDKLKKNTSLKTLSVYQRNDKCINTIDLKDHNFIEFYEATQSEMSVTELISFGQRNKQHF